MDTEWSLENWRHGQVSSERMCLQLLSIDGFTELDPQCPLGGRDGLKDILCKKDGLKYVAAAYFPTQKSETFKEIKDKFLHDLNGVKVNKVDGIVFLTGQKVSPAERAELSAAAAAAGAKDVIYHQERLVGLLNSPLGLAPRLEFLKIPMGLEDQMAWVLAMREKFDQKIQDAVGRVEKKVDEITSRNKEPQTPPPVPTEESGKQLSEKSTSSPLAANQQVIRVLGEVLGAVKKDELSQFSKSKSLDELEVARFGLAAASITNRDIESELPGVHLVNLLFKKRKTIELSALERVLILRANLVPELGYKPGWYWVRKMKRKGIDSVLLYFSCKDEHNSVREAAIEYAMKLGASFHKKTHGRSPIEILSSHSDASTRKIALKYLAEKGSISDLPLIEKFGTDADSDVRSMASSTRNAIQVRSDATRFFENSVLTVALWNDDRLKAVQGHIADIGTELFKKALAHPNAEVQLFAAKELTARSSITVEEIKALKDSEGACEVFRLFYLKAISAGKKFPPEEIRQALEPKDIMLALGLGSLGRIDANPVIAELFKLYTYEELSGILDSESDDSLIAYRVLAEKHFNKFGNKIREDLKTDFASLRAKFKSNDSGLGLSAALTYFSRMKWTPNIIALTAAGLSGLALSGSHSDHDLIIPFLKHKSDQVRIAALSALRRVGAPNDVEVALEIAENSNGGVSIEAAKTALALSSGDASASCLVKSKKVELVKLAIRKLITFDSKEVWPKIKYRLYDENDNIRSLICAYAIKKLSRQDLAKLLDVYLSEERYFYSVVYFLDRVLYAKGPLRNLFVKEIASTLEET